MATMMNECLIPHVGQYNNVDYTMACIVVLSAYTYAPVQQFTGSACRVLARGCSWLHVVRCCRAVGSSDVLSAQCVQERWRWWYV